MALTRGQLLEAVRGAWARRTESQYASGIAVFLAGDGLHVAGVETRSFVRQRWQSPETLVGVYTRAAPLEWVIEDAFCAAAEHGLL